ncbi:phage tail family protein [Mobilitalea sibirica]|uniref:Phage tail family protein n=1 Tax=Mobilitalea sibirica TaxID=1462919 RepID=A0A8J7KTQ3_9FIRM|nr:distal tail protein Dit [Mobilitalea sibirica]MBH1941631.1 phage tail family protein [Mobilitalea sibirica]
MIILDGKKLSEFGLICQPGHEHPMTPIFENLSLAIPGKDGLYVFGTEIRERLITLPLTLIEIDRVIRQQRLREFAAFLVDVYGKPRMIKLVFDYSPDKYYMVKCSEQMIPELLKSTGSFALPFTAYDPYAYSVVYADEVTWGSDVITFQSSYKLGHPGSAGTINITGPKTLDIYLDGLAIKPVVEISGSATSLSLSVNGYTINLPAFSNASWVIDCEKYTVLKNGSSEFGAVSLRDFILLPGNNPVQVAGSNINVTMRIKVRDKYI